ncbi:MAG: hypothetical protein R3D30_12460 [Hyphomicrobiales bacterium]
MTTAFSDPGATHPMSAESVSFKDGMIVTADDLRTAMHYPVALMQALNKAVYGCGVVCGFDLCPDPELCGKEGHCDPCNKQSEATYPNFIVQVGRGTALDCYGLPIELCKPVRVNVSPETCGCEQKSGIVCLFIRRVSASEAPRGDCCAQRDVPADCSRQRDHVLIRAFPLGQEPEHACMRSNEEDDDKGCGKDRAALEPGSLAGRAGGGNEVRRDDWDDARRKHCRCLTDCGDCKCCGDGWVLLGCIELCPGGIVKSSLDSNERYRRRKWIKTIECLCHREETESTWNGDNGGQVSAQLARAEDDRELELMQVRDPKIDEKIESMVSSEAHRKLFKAQRIRNLDHFIYVLETRMDEMKSLVQFARTPKNLDDYLTAARTWKGNEPMSEG